MTAISGGRARWDGAVAAAGLAATLLLPLSMLRVRAVAVDESEFLAATVRVREGLVPYRDFWEHHFPLQWYLMAPWTHLGDPPSVGDLVRARGLQSLLWVAFGLAFVSLLRRRGASAPAALAALSVLAATVLFSVFAVEYRIDTPMNVFFLVGLLLSERSLCEEGSAGARTAFGAGVAYALASLCSQRMIPTAVVALALYAFARDERRWGFRPASVAAWAGAGSVALAVAAAFAIGGGLGAFLDQNVAQNAAYEKLAALDGAGRLIPLWPVVLAVQHADAGFFVLLALSAVTLLLARRSLAPSGTVTRLLVLLLLQLALLSRIRSPNPYHLGTALALMALLSGLSIGVAAARGHRLAIPGTAAVALACSALAWSKTEVRVQADMAHLQDHVLSAVSRSSRPDESVLDGCGLAWNRRSAFEVWFLRPIALSLTRHGSFRPLDEGTLRERRPAVVIADYALVSYVPLVPGLERFLVRHYLPIERVVWIPAPNGRLAPGESMSWTVLRSGTYAVSADARLAGHPWFQTPLAFPALGTGRRDAFAIDLSRIRSDPALSVSVEGQEHGSPSAPLRLVAGQVVEAANRGQAPLGVFLRPEAERVFFQDPFPSVPLWSAPEAR